jgi:mono/diheme cytochrome c family protein
LLLPACRPWRVVVIALALVVAGCGSPPPQFALNLEGRRPESVSPKQREAIEKALHKLFGTPDAPSVAEQTGLRPERLAMAAGPVGGDAEGNQRGLFRRHCVTCHGISGDGAGPTAAVLDPYPRDFRLGLFKYTSTRGGAKPVRQDLRRTLLRGLPGTAMPSFAQLRSGEIDALVEYVKYLSLRGQTELYLMELVVDGDEPLPLTMEFVVRDGLVPLARAWAAPEEDPAEWVVVPPPRPSLDTPESLAESVARGRALYASKQAQCVRCHGPDGSGQGEETELYDDANKRKKGVTPEQTAELASRFRLPIQRLRPRDFRQGVFHGGARPEDLYLRVALGIKGTPMPGAGAAPGVRAVLSPEETWHLVSFIRALGAGAEASPSP